MTQLNQKTTLPDGRQLGYARFGDPRGRPLVFIHGFPNCRLEGGLLDGEARRQGIAIIAPDRPGFGLSDFQPGRRILDWPGDVLHLADTLGLDSFPVIGSSGGAPYALACAYRLPQRVSGIGVVAPLGPATEPQLIRKMRHTTRLAFLLAQRAPGLLRLIAGPSQLLARHPDLVFKLKKASRPDRDILARPEVRSVLSDSIREALQYCGRGTAHELLLMAGPWGFPVSGIKIPAHVWHGLRDDTVPPAMGEFLAREIPGAQLHLVPDEGHVSLSVKRARQILEAVYEPQLA